MRGYTKRVIDGCFPCARRKQVDYRQALEPEKPAKLPTPGLFHMWAIDVYGLLHRTSCGDSYVLVMVDHFSEWPGIVPVPSRDDHRYRDCP